jgi:hypothetical protein
MNVIGLGVMAWTGIASSQEVVELTSGEVLKGEMIAWDSERQIGKFRVRLEGPNGRGEAVRTFALEEVSLIDEDLGERETAILDGRATASVWDLRAYWQRSKEQLTFPNSPAGGFGLRLIKALAERGASRDAEEMLALAEAIAAGDWNKHRRSEALVWRMKAWVKVGELGRARGEAWEILKRDTDPRLKAEARLVLGEAALGRLRDLISESPRWQKDEERTAEAGRWIEQALEHFLYVSLFHGACEGAAAQGLWRVVQTHRLAGDGPSARAAVEDLLGLYPESCWATRARRLLDDLENEAEKGSDDV